MEPVGVEPTSCLYVQALLLQLFLSLFLSVCQSWSGLLLPLSGPLPAGL